jgi:hypothetical protein
MHQPPQKVQRGNMFTHHQKTVIVDTELTPGHSPPPMMNEAVPTRRILAFVGGLDLTNGRYDYPSHPLFDSCAPGGPHCIDMYQGCVEGEYEECLFVAASIVCLLSDSCKQTVSLTTKSRTLTCSQDGHTAICHLPSLML